MAKKKVVKAKPERVYNFNMMEYFLRGYKGFDMTKDYDLIVEGNKLIFNKDSEDIIALKSGKFIAINGDELEWDDDRDMVITELQQEDNAITTSFEIFNQANIDMDKIEIITISKDFSATVKPKHHKFKDFEKNQEQGTEITIYRNWSKKTKSYSGAITAKSAHRAGCMLFKYKGAHYLCGMDESSYFCTELKNKSKTIDAAFKSLKPNRVYKWEKESGKQAYRQGEWFFIPAPKNFEFNEELCLIDLPLPMKNADSHTHTPDKLQSVGKKNQKHYVQGCVYHEEHNSLYLKPDNAIFEAIENTAVNSWSIDGVD
jgi:hypothetical protein